MMQLLSPTENIRLGKTPPQSQFHAYMESMMAGDIEDAPVYAPLACAPHWFDASPPALIAATAPICAIDNTPVATADSRLLTPATADTTATAIVESRACSDERRVSTGKQKVGGSLLLVGYAPSCCCRAPTTHKNKRPNARQQTKTRLDSPIAFATAPEIRKTRSSVQSLAAFLNARQHSIGCLLFASEYSPSPIVTLTTSILADSKNRAAQRRQTTKIRFSLALAVQSLLLPTFV